MTWRLLGYALYPLLFATLMWWASEAYFQLVWKTDGTALNYCVAVFIFLITWDRITLFMPPHRDGFLQFPFRYFLFLVILIGLMTVSYYAFRLLFAALLRAPQTDDPSPIRALVVIFGPLAASFLVMGSYAAVARHISKG